MSKKHFSQLWKERALTVAVLFVLSTITMFAQKVTGVVRDASGEPLVGVNVVEKGSVSNGAVTNINGEYQINVAAGKTLVFSYIGYESKEQTVKGNKLNVYLKEDSKLISDVVVVGYGSMQRKDVTSSITTVKADDLNKGVFTDPAQMLQGKVPGLIVTSNGDPNGTPSIILRGTSTFRDGAMSPYYVVDGIPGVDISMVAPDDIESIDILRDATATAIYGSKAANGVILITTKSGKNGKTNVSYNAYVGFDQISNKLDMMDADGLRSLSQYGIAIDDNGGNTDWQKEVLRTGVSYNHNLSINGGSDKTKYSASVSYMDRKGIIKGTDFSRLNVRTLLTTKVLKDHLDLSVGANLVYGKHQGVAMNWHGESVIDAMNYYSPLNPIYNEDGSYYRVSVQPDKNYNPLSMINEDTGENNMKRQQFMAKATLHIIKGLDWNVNYAFNNYQRTNSTYNSHNSQVVSYKREGQSSRNTSFGHDNKFETFGNYEVKFNDIHKLTAMFGYSWEETVYGDSFGMTLDTYYPNSDESRWNGMNAMNVTNGIHGISSGNKEVIRNISFYGRLNYSFNSRYMIQATMRRDGSSAFGENNHWGTFPSVSAAWNITEEDFMKNQELFTNLKLRAGYGVSGNAMGIGAYSSRLLYAVNYGNSYLYTKDNETKTYYAIDPCQNENRNLKWESTGMFNVGIDFAFLGGRINGTIEFYNKKTSDLIYNYEVMKGQVNYDGTPINGVYPRYAVDGQNVNVGDITNRGVEFSINADIIKTRDFRWSSSLNLSHNTNKVDKLSNARFSKKYINQGDPDVAGVSSNGYTQNIQEGEAIGTFFLYEFAGFEDGCPVYYEHDDNGERTGNKIKAEKLDTNRDRVKAGTALPKLNLGWNNTFTWKNWNATLFVTGQFGNKIYNGTRANNLSTSRLSGASGTKNVLSDYVSEMVVDGKVVTDTNVPSDRWLENGSYLRLQTLTLGYTFRDCFNGWLKDIQVYGTVNNVFTITSYKGIDPELRLGGTDPGIDYSWNVYPHTRTFMLGAKINF